MRYEFEEQVNELIALLEALNGLIDDEDYFQSDIKKFDEELGNTIREVSDLLSFLKEEDPEIPIDHRTFILSSKEVGVGEGDNRSYHALLKFSADVVSKLQEEVTAILDDGEEETKIELFDQLTIPIISLVNHQMHPTRPGYLVYHYKIEEHAAYFEELLKERGLFYERFDELRENEQVFWFGVRDRDHDEVEIINYTVKGKFRKPLIQDKGARYFILIFGILVVTIAIIGAILSNS